MRFSLLCTASVSVPIRQESQIEAPFATSAARMAVVSVSEACSESPSAALASAVDVTDSSSRLPESTTTT